MFRVFVGLLNAFVCVALMGCWVTEPTEAKGDPPPADPLPLVREQLLRTHHETCVDLFVKADGLGRKRMPTLTHKLAEYPKSLYLPFDQGREDLPPGQPATEPQTTWVMEKVELVSLLMNNQPGIYPAEGMGTRLFKRPKTRDLDDFEQEALNGLRTGDSVKVKESPDHIRMLGAIRVREGCKMCHNQPEGTLLGAFSYVFKPGVANEKAPVNQNAPPPKPAK